MNSNIDWDNEFANTKYIPNGMEYRDLWVRRATEFRQQHRNSHEELAYGSHARQKFDLFLPVSDPHGLLIFIHGGFWLDFDKSYWSHLAQGCTLREWAVAIPSYVLAPEASIQEISEMVGQAVEICGHSILGPIVLVGHSAGGQIVLRLCCQDTSLSTSTLGRIRRFISISPISDLRNLRYTEMNGDLKLDTALVRSESPILHQPLPHASVQCWVGANERPEFLRQADRLFETWKKYLDDLELIQIYDQHHFSIIESLQDPQGALTLQVVSL